MPTDWRDKSTHARTNERASEQDTVEEKQPKREDRLLFVTHHPRLACEEEDCTPDVMHLCFCRQLSSSKNTSLESSTVILNIMGSIRSQHRALSQASYLDG